MIEPKINDDLQKQKQTESALQIIENNKKLVQKHKKRKKNKKTKQITEHKPYYLSEKEKRLFVYHWNDLQTDDIHSDPFLEYRYFPQHPADSIQIQRLCYY